MAGHWGGGGGPRGTSPWPHGCLKEAALMSIFSRDKKFFKEKVTDGVMSLSEKYWARRKLREAFFRVGEEKEPDPCA